MSHPAGAGAGPPNYQHSFSHVAIERSDGILVARFHSAGGPLHWGLPAFDSIRSAFRAIADDPGNRVVILTGTGDSFSGPAGSFKTVDGERVDPARYLTLRSAVAGMHADLLRIDVPVIAAVNGPAIRHAELALLSDIVLAADTACFQDSAHFIDGMPPGDGQHVIMPLAMGINRARYYLLTGQRISAEQALAYGLVNEVVPSDAVMPRALELADQLCRQPQSVLRASRRILTKQIRRSMEDLLEYGLDLEGLAIVDPGTAP